MYSHPSQSPMAAKFATKNVEMNSVAAIMWSDDCDPQNSKKNCKAIWCLTITFLQEEDVTTDSPIPTFPIAIGSKGADH